MPKILVRAKQVITMNAKREIVEDGAVAIEDNQIVAVDKFDEL